MRTRRASILTVEIDLFVPRAERSNICVAIGVSHGILCLERERPKTRDSFLSVVGSIIGLRTDSDRCLMAAKQLSFYRPCPPVLSLIKLLPKGFFSLRLLVQDIVVRATSVQLIADRIEVAQHRLSSTRRLMYCLFISSPWTIVNSETSDRHALSASSTSESGGYSPYTHEPTRSLRHVSKSLYSFL